MTRHVQGFDRPVHRPAFTLVELLVVIAIIGVLMAITFTIGRTMLAAGKTRQTEATLRILDQSMTAYRSVREGPFPSVISLSNNAQIPLIDGVVGPDQIVNGVTIKQSVPTTAWFIKQISEGDPVEQASALVRQIDTKLLRISNNPPPASGGGPVAMWDVPGKKTEVLDGWGNPIRMVHPRYAGIIQGGARATGSEGTTINPNNFAPLPVTSPAQFYGVTQFRRNWMLAADRQQTPGIIGDSDGGVCVGDTPYFYSCGPDGDPSTIEDNVYTVAPRRPQ